MLFCNVPPRTVIHSLSLHDALPISPSVGRLGPGHDVADEGTAAPGRRRRDGVETTQPTVARTALPVPRVLSDQSVVTERSEERRVGKGGACPGAWDHYRSEKVGAARV